MRRSLVLLSALRLAVALPSASIPSAPDVFTINWKREEPSGGDIFNATTTFHVYECNSTQVKLLEQAHKDALLLVQAAFSRKDKELKALVDDPNQFIDFTTQAAIDYFGPSDHSPSQQTRIYDTFYRASQTYPGWGLNDWWNGRYMEIYCNDFADDCVNKKTGGKYVGYTSQTDPKTNTPRRWPWINYCPAYFDILPSHDEAVAAIKSDTTGRKKLNTKNMRTRATTSLHEWLHVNNNYSSMVCDGGCLDTKQYIGGVSYNTYKSGATKLLARRDPVSAAKTNDNFAYFATSRFMQKTFETYPDYPLAWDINKTPAQNMADEKLQPGDPDSTPNSLSALLADDQPDPDNNPPRTVPSDTPLLDSKAYPAWYQPVLSAKPPTSTPTPPVMPPVAQPDLSKISCSDYQNGPVLPAYNDCVAAFTPSFVMDDKWASKPPVPSKSTTQYTDLSSGTCGVAIAYTGAWDSSCNATRGDVWAHGLVVFEACTRHGAGVVGGNVPLNVHGCPANITIVHTVEAIPDGPVG